MPSPIDLTTVIEDSITDATLPEDTSTDVSSELPETGTQLEASSEGLEAATDDSIESEGIEATTDEVASPAASTGQVPEGSTFGMDKKLGIPSHTNGRENRIPYSRVKKIVENAEKAAITPLQTKLAELEPKVQDYEQRLMQVAQFEHVLVNEPQQFLQYLAQIPAYQGFFQTLERLSTQVTSQAQAQNQTVDNDPMPEPDEDDGQGGKVYSFQGLNKLLEWQKRQAKNETLREVESKYEPIRQEWEAQQRLNKLVPVVENQIKEARTWEKFNENEQEIVQYLNTYPNASLETAYRAVVVPKLRADRDAIRKQVLGELQKAPAAATSATARPSRGSAIGDGGSGPRSMEDVIRESMRAAGLK